MVENENLKNLFNDIKKKHGEGLITFGDTIEIVPIISTSGSYKLDSVIGGGIAGGRNYVYYGPPSSGKSTFSLITISEFQKKGLTCAYVDAENSFDKEYSKNLGVDVDNLIMIQPDYGEQAFDIMEKMLKSNEIKLIVVDSVNALVPIANLQNEFVDQTMGLHARMMSRGLARLNASVKSSECSIIWLSQVRQKIGGYGNPEEISGGEALKFYSSCTLRISRSDVIGDKEDPDGFITKIKVTKSKLSRPFSVVETYLYIGKNDKYGVDKQEELVNLAIENNIVSHAGAWFKLDVNGIEERFQGREKLIQFLKSSPEIYEVIKNRVLVEVLKLGIDGNKSIENDKDQVEDKKERKRRSKKDEENLNLEEINIKKEE